MLIFLYPIYRFVVVCPIACMVAILPNNLPIWINGSDLSLLVVCFVTFVTDVLYSQPRNIGNKQFKVQYMHLLCTVCFEYRSLEEIISTFII